MMDSARTADGAFWLSKARTDPAWQRRGVATAILEAAAVRGRRRRLHALRLWTNADNRSGNEAARRNGFREVARFFGSLGRPLLEPPRSNAHVPRTRLWPEVRGSTLLADGHGYIPADWHFVRWSRGLARHPAVASVRQVGGAILASRSLRGLKPLHGWFAFAVLRGPTAAALREGRRLAGAAGTDRAFVYLPAIPAYRRSARGAGFRTVAWGTEAIVYERRL